MILCDENEGHECVLVSCRDWIEMDTVPDWAVVHGVRYHLHPRITFEA